MENPLFHEAKYAQKRAYKEARSQGLSVFEASKIGDAAFEKVMNADSNARAIRSFNQDAHYLSRPE
jgi:hypothetical protein